MNVDQKDIDAVLLLEERRIKALLENDITTLEALLDERLVHVHTTGKLENYTSYLTGVKTNLRFLSIERGPIDVRIYGNTAIMTGALDQRLRILAGEREMELASIATQIWVKTGDEWKLAGFHACRRD